MPGPAAFHFRAPGHADPPRRRQTCAPQMRSRARSHEARKRVARCPEDFNLSAKEQEWRSNEYAATRNIHSLWMSSGALTPGPGARPTAAGPLEMFLGAAVGAFVSPRVSQWANVYF